MKLLAVILSLMLAATPVFAQRGDMKGAGKQQGMSKDQREGLRRDVRDFNQGPGRNRQDRPPQRQLTPQEREKLRRDIEGANKDMRR